MTAHARTRIRRLPERQVTDRERIDAILDAGRVAHVAVVDGGQPFVIPVAYARDGDRVLIHGSTGSRLMRALAAGAPTCLTVTILDGLVLARSVFEHSMNYRSVVVLGTARRLDGDEALAAFAALTDRMVPGRWADARPPSAKEIAATMILELDLAECSAKVRDGGPEDMPADLVDPRLDHVWTGVVPLSEHIGVPQPAPESSAPVPDYIVGWSRTTP